MTDFTDETLMRYADGELDEEAAAALEQAMETDEALVARVAMFMETRALAQEALKPLLAEPVPQRLASAVDAMVEASRSRRQEQAATVVPLRPAARPAHVTPAWRLPLAASLAAVLGGLVGYWLAFSGQPEIKGLAVAGIDSPALGQALATQPSGSELQLGAEGRFRAIATFRDATQAICREFEVDTADRSTVVAVACRRDGAWRVSFAVAAQGDTSGYAPASSSEALDAYLAAIEAMSPMEADEETRALDEARR